MRESGVLKRGSRGSQEVQNDSFAVYGHRTVSPCIHHDASQSMTKIRKIWPWIYAEEWAIFSAPLSLLSENGWGGGEGGIFCMKSPLYREIAYSGIPDCQGKSKVRRDAEQSRFSSSRGGDKRFSSRDSDKRFSLRDSDKRFFSRDSVKRFSSRDGVKR